MPKIPHGYTGTYAKNNDGSATLIMVSRTDSIAETKNQRKEVSKMPNPNSTFTPYTTEQKREYGRQFTERERESYRKGQRNAYSHMGNIGKRNSYYIQSNLATGGSVPPAPVKSTKQTTTRKSTKR